MGVLRWVRISIIPEGGRIELPRGGRPRCRRSLKVGNRGTVRRPWPMLERPASRFGPFSLSSTRRLISTLAVVACLATLRVGYAEAHSPAGYQLTPPSAIGPVSLGESKWRVERALRHPTRTCHSLCVRTYNRRRGNLLVQYDRGDVIVVGSRSGQITLDGVPLGLGPEHFRKILRRWRHFSCERIRIYEYGSGPTATIDFNPDHSIDVEVSAANVGGCLAP